jgi:hypothetical protein
VYVRSKKATIPSFYDAILARISTTLGTAAKTVRRMTRKSTRRIVSINR